MVRVLEREPRLEERSVREKRVRKYGERQRRDQQARRRRGAPVGACRRRRARRPWRRPAPRAGSFATSSAVAPGSRDSGRHAGHAPMGREVPLEQPGGVGREHPQHGRGERHQLEHRPGAHDAEPQDEHRGAGVAVRVHGIRSPPTASQCGGKCSRREDPGQGDRGMRPRRRATASSPRSVPPGGRWRVIGGGSRRGAARARDVTSGTGSRKSLLSLDSGCRLPLNSGGFPGARRCADIAGVPCRKPPNHRVSGRVPVTRKTSTCAPTGVFSCGVDGRSSARSPRPSC